MNHGLPISNNLAFFLLFPLYVSLPQGSLRSLQQGSALCFLTQALWLSTSKTVPQPTTSQWGAGVKLAAISGNSSLLSPYSGEPSKDVAQVIKAGPSFYNSPSSY